MMFDFWHIAAIVLVFALGFILGGRWRKNKSKKEAMHYLMERLSHDLKENNIEMYRKKPITDEDQKKFEALLRDRT
tara:strand:- start:467 stop:694 length:228 start_codon:yes stop_codon:yes gene_type:complete